MPAARPIGTIVRVAVDWLVVSTQTRKTPSAKIHGAALTQRPTLDAMSSVCAPRKVSVSQARPNKTLFRNDVTIL